MTSKKKQHYVPRFYLRNFSWDDKKAINLYNKKAGKIITSSNLYNQCHESYFYGEDLLIENAFSDIEGVTSEIISGMLNNGCSPPAMNSSNHHALLVYTLLQYSRTKYALSAYDEMQEKFCKNVILQHLKAKYVESNYNYEDIENLIEIKINNSIQRLIASICRVIPIAADIRYKLLKNNTSIQFLTSDNPVVFYNMCYEKSKFGSYTGLATKGLQIFLPLSPKYLLAFYDGVTYKIGEKKKFIIDVTDINDIKQMNDLQWLNSLENLYFHRDFSIAELDNIRKRNQKREYSEKSIVNEYAGQEHPDGKSSPILHMYQPNHKIGLNLQCLRQLWKPTETELDIMPKPLRDPLLCELNDKFLQLVDAKKYQITEFSKFITDIQTIM